MAVLLTDKAFANISTKYSDFIDIFLLKAIVELSKYIGINTML